MDRSPRYGPRVQQSINSRCGRYRWGILFASRRSPFLSVHLYPVLETQYYFSSLLALFSPLALIQWLSVSWALLGAGKHLVMIVYAREKPSFSVLGIILSAEQKFPVSSSLIPSICTSAMAGPSHEIHYLIPAQPAVSIVLAF